VNVIKSG